MKRVLTLATAGLLVSALVAPTASAFAAQQSKKKSSSKGSVAYSGPETGLLGIRIYDSALRVISMYGNPDQIAAVSIGSTSDAGGGGGGARGGFGGPGGGGGRGGGGGGAQPAADAEMLPGDLVPGGIIPGGPFDGPDRNNFFQGEPRPQGFAPPGGGGAPGGPPGGGPGGGGGGGGATEAATFTRWTYTRNGTKLGFVVDKFNRVVQIEAIGLQNQRVKTRRGVGFGSTFSTVMKNYGRSYDPDGYDISSNNFTVRFLTRGRVAFRLSRLSNKQAHVVTGIVVAAGKQ